MNFLASLVRRQQPAVAAPAGTGPKPLAAKDFQQVGGGSPRGTWSQTPVSTQSPRGTW